MKSKFALPPLHQSTLIIFGVIVLLVWVNALLFSRHTNVKWLQSSARRVVAPSLETSQYQYLLNRHSKVGIIVQHFMPEDLVSELSNAQFDQLAGGCTQDNGVVTCQIELLLEDLQIEDALTEWAIKKWLRSDTVTLSFTRKLPVGEQFRQTPTTIYSSIAGAPYHAIVPVSGYVSDQTISLGGTLQLDDPAIRRTLPGWISSLLKRSDTSIGYTLYFIKPNS